MTTPITKSEAPEAKPETTLTIDVFATLSATINDKSADELRPWLLSDEVIGQAATLSKPEIATLAGLIRDRKVRGLSADWINRDWRPSVTERQRAQRQQQQSERPPARENPYTEIGGRTFCNEKGEWIPVCDFTAQITGQIINEHGEKTFIVTGEGVRSGAFSVEVRANQFGDPAKLQSILESISPVDGVYNRMRNHLPPAIKKLSNLDDITTITRYDRTGWAGGVFLAPGREPAGVEVALPEKLPYRLNVRGADLDRGMDALKALIESLGPEVTTPIISTLMQAPLANLAGWRNERYSTFAVGRTGSLKTTFAQVAMCIYGPGFSNDEKLIRWGQGGTGNAIMHLATGASDMSFLVDNFKPNIGNGSKDFDNLIHAITEGSEKDRMQRHENKMRAFRPLHCWPIFTGEDVPTKDPASLARLLLIRFPLNNQENNGQLSKAQDDVLHLSAVGSAWIDWLESESARAVIEEVIAGTEETDGFVKLRSQWFTKLRGANKDVQNGLRVATNLATNELTWKILGRHPYFGYIFQKYAKQHKAGLETIAKTMALSTAENLPAQRFLAALNELVSTGKVILLVDNAHHQVVLGERRESLIVGWRDGLGGAHVYMDAARQLIEKLLGENLDGATNNAIYSQLDSLGLIEKGGDQTTKYIKRGGKVIRALHILPKAFDQDDEPV